MDQIKTYIFFWQRLIIISAALLVVVISIMSSILKKRGNPRISACRGSSSELQRSCDGHNGVGFRTETIFHIFILLAENTYTVHVLCTPLYPRLTIMADETTYRVEIVGLLNDVSFTMARYCLEVRWFFFCYILFCGSYAVATCDCVFFRIRVRAMGRADWRKPVPTSLHCINVSGVKRVLKWFAFAAVWFRQSSPK